VMTIAAGVALALPLRAADGQWPATAPTASSSAVRTYDPLRSALE
jgi:hypothetical protein